MKSLAERIRHALLPKFVAWSPVMLEPQELLMDLVAIPSVNPMGQEVSGAEFFEAGMTNYLLKFFATEGIPTECLEVMPGRANVIACVRGLDSLPTVLWDAHQDTVPVGEMSIPPFQPSIQNGRMYGRGTCDVKGGMAAMLCALVRLKHECGGKHPTVVMACTCDEEFDELGVTQLIQSYTSPLQSPLRSLSSPPDYAVVAEPTELNVAVAHRGATRWKLRTRGVAAHSSDPSQGVNAIYRMAEVVRCLEAFASQLHSETEPHPRCGSRTLSIGKIVGGTSVNIVPAECTIEIDRRIVPGEDGHEVIDQLETYLREQLDFDIEMLPPWTVGVPLSDEFNRELAERFLQHGRDRWPSSQSIGVPYGTHAAQYARSGVPSIVFGPGSVAQAHTQDEWIDLEQLEAAAEMLYQFIAEWNE